MKFMKLSAKTIHSLTLIGLFLVFTIYFSGLTTTAGKSLAVENPNQLQVMEGAFLVGLAEPPYPEVVKTIDVIVTAYSSTVDQTDSDPFITASGDMVQDGIVANNLLPFGTLVQFPELYGDKMFVVKDRMHSRKGFYHADIWFPEREQATAFGVVKTTQMQILN